MLNHESVARNQDLAADITLLAYFFWVLLGRILRNWIIVLLFDQTVTLLLGG
jgi:hypothetical protein